MTRRTRIFVPGLSQHLIHRGNNRSAIFSEGCDYEKYLDLLAWRSHLRRVSIHAYVLMTNHVHLEVTPETAEGVPALMMDVAGRYSTYYNRRNNRIGALWKPRYRALPIADERYWLTCLRYIEQNPVRAGMVPTPADYAWSSYQAHAFGEKAHWLTLHPLYLSLGTTPAERQAAYQSLCGAPVDPGDALAIR